MNVFDAIFEQVFGLNQYQMKSIEEQRNITQLFFENIPSTILQVLMLFGYIPLVGDADDSPIDLYFFTLSAQQYILISFAMTLLNVIV